MRALVPPRALVSGQRNSAHQRRHPSLAPWQALEKATDSPANSTVSILAPKMLLHRMCAVTKEGYRRSWRATCAALIIRSGTSPPGGGILAHAS